MNLFSSLSQKVVAWFNRRRRKREISLVSFDGRGVIIDTKHPDGTPDQMLIVWSDISRIAVYKRDVFAYDLICLFIERSSGGGLEINEEDAGWYPFVENLNTFLPAATPYSEWVLKVIQPPFHPSMSVIFDGRKKHAPDTIA